MIILSVLRSANWLFVSALKGKMQRRLADNESPEPSNAADIGVWISLVAMSTLMKLTSSTDDVVWLLPFLSGPSKRRNMIVYVASMQFVVLLSWSFSFGGEALLGYFVPEDPDWPLAKILSLISAVLLTLFTLKLFYDWWRECHEPAEDAESAEDDAQSAVAWEVAWDHQNQRWFFQDRRSGQSSFQRPPGCMLDLPESPPGDTSLPPAPADLPVGWRVAWDFQTSRYYFYHPAEKKRSWTHPSKESFNSVVPSVVGNVATQVTGSDRQPLSTKDIKMVEEEGNDSGTSTTVSEKVGVQAVEQRSADATGRPASDQKDQSKHTFGKLCTISLMGSLDDFAVQVSLMLAGVLTAPQILLGTFLGSLIVVCVCLGAGLFGPVVRCVERIPLWCIIGAFAIWTYITTFVMEAD